MTTPQAVILIRVRHVGSNEQVATQFQIETQRLAGQKVAQRLGADVALEYIEYGGTDRLERRPILRQMLAELGQTPEVRYVITYGADRVARRISDYAEIEQAIEAAGAQLTLSDNLSRKEI